MVKQHSSGFTLIEILMVLMMISLLTLILCMPVIVSNLDSSQMLRPIN